MTNPKAERLQKILARAGLASRRHAEEMITNGRVRVNGHIVSELGAKADPVNDRIEVDGERLVAERFVYLIFHKPRGVVSTMADPEGRASVKDALKQHPSITERVFPVGRLDFATSGALLITNDGDFMNGLLHPKTDVPKQYIVKVSGKMSEEDMELWRTGVTLEDGVTKRADVKLDRFEDDKTWFYVTLTEGRNQQIRRMGEATRFPVMRLSRVSFAGVTTENLPPGAMRSLTRDELMAIRKRYDVPRKLPSSGDLLPPQQKRDVRVKSGRNDRARSPGAANRGKKPVMHRSESTTDGPRYGGGSPGRRGYDVKEDWGGGAGRGRSGGASEAAQSSSNRAGSGRGAKAGASGRGASDAGGSNAPRGDVGGGRYGRTRTTGTAGGIGAAGDADRVKSRGSRGR